MDDQRTDRESGGSVKYPRFTLVHIFFSAAMIGIGLAGIFYLFVNAQDAALPLVRIWLGSGALIGAGLLTPFDRPFLGAMLGFAAQLFFGVVWFLTLGSHTVG